MDTTATPEVEQFDVEAVNKKEKRSLYQARRKIFPKRVSGAFRKFKWWMMGITLTIYYVTPWMRWERGPGLPDQAVLIDMPGRRFYFFFIEIWPQELFFITGLLVMAGIGLFLTTSTFGRMWCGYSCPQTVWTDLFILVERWIEGDRNARIRLDKAKLSVDKLTKRSIKFVVWLLIALCTGGAWVFYFADAPTLAVNLVTFEAPVVAYATIGILTSLTFLLGGFAREQVCTYMCPWPRIMGAMMDEDSLVVTYRERRGEPRGSLKAGDEASKFGDCVDCNACVAVCPMGIDIRDGQQLECITCALCIDACNNVMEKVGRPKGLIGYASVSGEAHAAAGKKWAVRIVRPRTIIYFAIWSLVGLVMLYALFNRPVLDTSVLRDRNPLFVMLSDGSVRNGYTFKILNKSHQERTYRLSIKGIDGATVAVSGFQGLSNTQPTFTVQPDRVRSFRLFVTAPRASLTTVSSDIEFILEDINGDDVVSYDSVFRGPDK